MEIKIKKVIQEYSKNICLCKSENKIELLIDGKMYIRFWTNQEDGDNLYINESGLKDLGYNTYR